MVKLLHLFNKIFVMHVLLVDPGRRCHLLHIFHLIVVLVSLHILLNKARLHFTRHLGALFLMVLPFSPILLLLFFSFLLSLLVSLIHVGNVLSEQVLRSTITDVRNFVLLGLLPAHLLGHLAWYGVLLLCENVR